MISILIILIIFGIIFFQGSKEDKHLNAMKPFLIKIIEESGFQNVSSFELLKSRSRTYTENKKQIHVVIDKKDGSLYNFDTLMFVVLHEIAHIISPDHHHTSRFHQIEKRLHQKAIERGWLKMNQVDRSYPCHK